MAKTLEKPSLYDTDYVAWLEEQAAHLRAGRLSALDAPNVAEELEGLARSDRLELANRLETLILHLLKWDHQPEQRSNRWRASVAEQRRRIRRLLKESPSLRPALQDVAWEVYADALEQAVIETRISESALPETLPYSLEQLFERKLRRTSCPPDPPERSTHDRASDPDRPPASRRQRRHRAHRPVAQDRRGRRAGDLRGAHPGRP